MFKMSLYNLVQPRALSVATITFDMELIHSFLNQFARKKKEKYLTDTLQYTWIGMD